MDLVAVWDSGAVPVEIVEADVERDNRDAQKVGVPHNLDVRVLSPPEGFYIYVERGGVMFPTPPGTACRRRGP